jgi:hypothetical protein
MATLPKAMLEAATAIEAPCCPGFGEAGVSPVQPTRPRFVLQARSSGRRENNKLLVFLTL